MVLGQDSTEAGTGPGNTGREAEIQPGWDSGPTKGIIHTHSHLGIIFRVNNTRTCMFWGSGLENPGEMLADTERTSAQTVPRAQGRTRDPGLVRCHWYQLKIISDFFLKRLLYI